MQNHTSAEPEKDRTDWEGIEKHYRAGVLSIREISRLYCLKSDNAIRRKAKKFGWARDLTNQVQEKVRADLVRTDVRTPYARGSGDMRTEHEIVDNAAGMVVAVVREHRAQIASGRNMVQLLMGQLMQAIGSRADLESDVAALTEDELQGQKRGALKKALSLGDHAVMVRDLSVALKNLIVLERQAFNVDAMAPQENKPTPQQDSEVIDAKYGRLKQLMYERLGQSA